MLTRAICKKAVAPRSLFAFETGPDIPFPYVILVEKCSNLDYDAQNPVKETTIEGVDMVLAVTPNRLLKEALERAVEKCRQGQDAAQQPKPLILLDAGECLEPDFDWMNILERPL